MTHKHAAHRTEHPAAQEHLRQLVETARVILWRKPAGPAPMSFINAEAHRLLGFPSDSWLTDPHFLINVIHPDDRAAFLSLCEAATSQEGHSLDLRLFTSKGATVWLSTSVRKLVHDEGVELVGVMTDATHRRRASEHAERVMSAKGEFLAVMSHEIRTPLNAVIGMTELLSDTSLTCEQREYLTTVRVAAESLLEIANRSLDLAKIDAGRLELETVTFPPQQHLEEVIRLLALRAHQKGLDLLCHVCPGVPVSVSGDAGRLRQVLLNLTGNAIKFTEKGSVLVDLCFDPGVGLRYRVSDTGIGIPSDKQSRIFEAYTQADSSTTRKFGGTGLGLTISKRLIQAMGGQLHLDSEPGAGSTFSFSIPVKAPVRPMPLGSEFAALSGCPILVLDANPEQRRILCEITSRWGMRALAAASVEDAFHLLQEQQAVGNPLPLLMADANLLAADRFALLVRLRKALLPLPAVTAMITSLWNRQDADRCREFNIHSFLMKPIRQADLQAELLRLLDDTYQEPSPDRTAAAPQGPPETCRILLVEDHPVNRHLCLRILQKAGHSVSVAGNGVEALALLSNQQFDLVLMDAQMPEMDGFDTTQAIRRGEAGRNTNVPVIAFTALAMAGDRERCIAAGMNDYVSKPVNAAALLQAVERNFARRARL